MKLLLLKMLQLMLSLCYVVLVKFYKSDLKKKAKKIGYSSDYWEISVSFCSFLVAVSFHPADKV